MNPLVVSEFSGMLNLRYGWDGEVLGEKVLASVLKRRMKQLGLSREEEFLALAKDDNELDFLGKELAVGETWFFRHEKSLKSLLERMKKRSNVSILSFGCSTGEEAYSLAILALEAGISSPRIIAMDLLQTHLDLAQQAVYRKRALREVSSHRLNLYFEEQNGNWAVRQGVKKHVRFYRANGALPELLTGWYDAIVCRNLMLYMDEKHRKSLLLRFRTLLYQDGGLLVSSVEAPLVKLDDFVQADSRMPIFHREARTLKKRPIVKRPFSMLKQSPERLQPPTPLRRNFKVSRSASFQEISKMVNRGQLEEAISLCHRLVAQHPTGDSYALLGVLRDASGESLEAANCYSRALQVDPKNETALLHLALAHERNGNQDKADALRAQLENE